jgi:hypothetical protein
MECKDETGLVPLVSRNIGALGFGQGADSSWIQELKDNLISSNESNPNNWDYCGGGNCGQLGKRTCFLAQGKKTIYTCVSYKAI